MQRSPRAVRSRYGSGLAPLIDAVPHGLQGAGVRFGNFEDKPQGDLGMRSVPCQVPTISDADGDASADGCGAGDGAAVCDAGTVVCVYAQAPFPASRKVAATQAF